MLTKRENLTMARIRNTQRSTDVLKNLINMGFKNFPAIVAISQHYFPEMTRPQLLAFWHFRNVSEDTVKKMETVLDNLKSE